MFGNHVHPTFGRRSPSFLAAVRGIAIAVLAGAAVWPSASEGGSFPPSEQVFPATTKAWLSVPDPQGLQASFDRTQYGQLLKDPSMKPFVESFRAQLRKAGRQRLGKLGLTLEDLEKVPGGELAIAAIEPQPGVLATVLLVDTTGHEADTKALIDTIVERLVEQKATKVAGADAASQITTYLLPPDAADPVPRQRHVSFGLAQSALVVGDDPAQVGQVFASLAQGRKDCLATLKSFDAVAAQSRKGLAATAAPIRWYVDPLGYAKVYRAANPPREKRKGPDYVAILSRQGFDAVRGAGGLIVFDDGVHEMRHQTIIFAPPVEGRPATGPDRFNLAARMLNFPDSERIDPPQWVPRDISSWIALRWDLQTAFASAESLVDDIVGEKGVFDDVIASLKEDPDGPQIDVEKDLVACLGKSVSVISDHSMPIDTDSERLLIAIEAIDAERVAATVAKSMATDPDMAKVEFNGHVIWEMIDRSMSMPKLEVETPGGSVAHADHEDDAHRRRAKLREREEKLLPHSAVTVANGHLLIASHRDFLERVLTASAGTESLGSAADYNLVSTELRRLFPSKSAMRTFGRADESIRPTYEMLRQGSMPKSKSVMGQILNAVLGDGKEGSVREQRIDGSTLPEFEQVRRYFGTVGLAMETVPDGWRIAGVALPRGTQEPEVARRPVAPVGR